VFIKLTQGRVIKTGAIKQFRAGFRKRRSQTDLDDLRRVLVHYMQAEQTQVVVTEEQFIGSVFRRR
jgi:hypothetical protein